MTTPIDPDRDRDGDVLDGNLKTLLAEADPAANRPEARARIRAGLVARHARPVRERSPVALAGWGLVAAATGALVIANLRGGGDASRGGAPAAAAGRSDTLALADGTTAELGAGGRVDVLGPRRVRVRGQVLLDVAPGQGTFTVTTEHGELAVLGTRFLVEASPDRTTAAVLRGVVAMRSAGAEEVVRAGEQGAMTRQTPPTRGPAPRLSHLVSWVAERRRRDERVERGPARSGALLARDPQWQDRELPLPLRQLTVDVHLENQIARVALDQTFHNPHDQTLEGVYKFALPPDAAVARLAMYVDGRLTESAVVERMRARRIYEDIVYQRRDPALLEQMGASKVSMRIFPLVGHQDKRVILAYTQPLARTYDDVTLTVPLPDLEQPVAEVALQVKVTGCDGCEISSPSHAIDVQRTGGDATVTHRASNVRLGDSLVLRLRQPDAPATTVATTVHDAHQYALVRVRPTVDATAAVAVDARPHRWVILDDTSASRGLIERRAQAELIDRMIQEIDETDQVMVVAFDATQRRFADWQAALAVDRRALARHLTEDGGLGETDLVAALDGAVAALAGQPGYVVYVGDGTATGARRTIDQLRDAIAGKATFIGLGVGDGVDLPTLSALADATGGLATHLDLGDDLAWRALDLVAALYTPRVTGLTAELDAAVGTAAPLADGEASAYLRAGQVAAGEDVEVVVRVPARADLRAVILRGQVGGRPWTQTVRLADTPRAPGDAGYLPRLWAERRLDALATAGDRALAPCTTTPCPSDEERAIAAYHARKDEMVALGKAHFLLSPHTSLIVLENDAMYAQYGVTKGSGATWAPYAAPATIPVTRVAASVVDERRLWRTPAAWQYDDQAARKDADLAGFVGAYGTIGTGPPGTLGHGSGTGSGYGVGAGKGGGGAVVTASPAVEKSATASERAPQEEAEPRVDVNADPVGQPAATEAAGPAPVTVPVGGEVAEPKRDRATRFAEDDDALLGGLLGDDAGASGFGVRGRSATRRAAFDRHDGWAGRRQQYRYSGINPIAFHHSGDWRLDDLTEWMPGLMRTRYDDLADGLDAAAAGTTGSITDDARRALDDARRTLRPGRWRWSGDSELIVDGAGRIARRETLDTGLVEELRYDGATLRHAYPELGVEATRAVGDHEPALYAALLPILPPRPDHLARFYQVTLSGPRTLRLAPAGGHGDVVELDLGDDGVIVAMRRVRGADTTTVMTVRRAGAGFELTIAGRTAVVTYQADPTVAVDAGAAQPVAIALPLRAPQHWQTALATLPPGDPAWRDAQYQLAATALALGNPGLVAQVARQLADRGPLTPAELAMVGGAQAWLGGDDAVRLAGNAGGAVGAYLRATRSFRDRPRTGVYAAVADQATGLIATLARYREVLVAGERGDLAAARAAFEQFVLRHPGAETLRLIAATRIAQQHAWRDALAVEVLDTIAAGPWRNVLRAEAARMAQAGGRGGSLAASADRWVALMSDVDLAASPPAIDWNAKYVVEQSARGAVGWQLALAAWKQRVLAGGDLDHVMAFAAAAAMTPGEDLDQALERAAALAAAPDALTEVVAAATAWNRLDRARSLLDQALTHYPASAGLLRLASAVAERQGDPRLAADRLQRALAADADRPVALSQLRADYGRLIGLHGQVARTASGADRDAAVDAAVAVGREWRAMDPEHAARERQLGELLAAIGREAEAWRYLSTPIDLNPRDGASFQVAAEVLERAGKLDQALGLWRRAFALDATNPTWLQRAAQVELALGRTDDARRTIDRIARGPWHVRWDGVKSWAQSAQRR